jgi:general secretion pathway protein B
MSYILDALRKADAERERDPARGIHAQPLAPLPIARKGAPLLWGTAAVAAIGIAGGVYALRSSQPAQPSPVAVRAAAVAAAGEGQPLAPAAPPVADAVQPPAPPMPQPAAVRPAVPARPQIVALAAQGGGAAPAPAQVAAALETPAPAVVLKAPATATPAPAQPEATRVLAYAELPPDVQGALPKLAITGGVHSENAAQRMLIVGGQVFAEGAELAPGVTLEQIRPKAAVLRFRGYRYSVFY